MNRILNIGSLNIDFVYQVPHFVRPGETLRSTKFTRGPGGKGLNQSIAAARAGAAVRHAGCIGGEGLFLRELLESEGVDLSALRVGDEPTGHAIIQVNVEGENSILLYPGANHFITHADLEVAFADYGKGDLLLLQNEINALPEILRMGHERGLTIVLNTAPMTADVSGYPLELVNIFVCNEQEAGELSGEQDAKVAAEVLLRRFPKTELVITLGSQGCLYRSGSESFTLPAEPVVPEDTTAAGDTFVGYFAAGLVEGLSRRESLELATKAAAITVQRPGAAASIPKRSEVG